MKRRQRARGIHFENRTCRAVRSADIRSSVEVAVAPLGQSAAGKIPVAARERIKGRQARQGTGDIHLENRAVAFRATAVRGTVEVSVAPLDQPGGGTGPITSRKGMQGRHRARRIHFKNRAHATCTALIRGPIEVSIVPFDQSGQRLSSIDPRKGMERREGARGGYFENGALVKRVARPAAG